MIRTSSFYSISRDREEELKAEQANEILADRALALSVQVLEEFDVEATRSSRSDALTHEQASNLLSHIGRSVSAAPSSSPRT